MVKPTRIQKIQNAIRRLDTMLADAKDPKDRLSLHITRRSLQATLSRATAASNKETEDSLDKK